ncbi:MAG: TonB-dependent receptor [Gemmatimonadaceae bacterium]
MRAAAGPPRRFVALGLAFLGWVVPVAGSAQSRQVTLADSTASRADSHGGVLSRRVSVHLTDVPLDLALRHIAQVGGLRLSYSSDLVPVTRRVTIARDQAPVGDVLADALRGTDVDIIATPAGHVVLVRMPFGVAAASVPSDSGRVQPVVARPPVRAQIMDRVLVMGTPAFGAPERELPTAVTVLTSTQLSSAGIRSMEDLFRTGIPGVVAWDQGIAGPFAQIGSVRGSSSFTSNYLKTYVDGVELASPVLLFAIDPASIERIEVIRGPQGSALYGSDAISGVVQVVTKHGRLGSGWMPQADLTASAGMQESRFVDGRELAQRHTGFATSGGRLTSIGVGGSYDDAGAIVPGGHEGYRSVFAGTRQMLGPLRVEGTARYADVRFTAAQNPLLSTLDVSTAIRPQLTQQRIQNETYGALVDYQPLPRWRQTLIVGLDRHAGAIPSQGEPATVADALLGATEERESKSSIRYSTVLTVHDGPTGAASFTLGAERASLLRERLGFWSNIFGSGNGLASLYSDRVVNTGVFAQAKVDVRHALFLTAGLRREQNTSFGPLVGDAWSPMLGAAFTRDLGGSTLKLRYAYGKGLRPPPSNARRALISLTFQQVENPNLEPESQSGFEAGIEWYHGDRASVSLTGYHQSADGLVQQVILGRATQNSLRSIQYQNVGRIENAGLEMEGAARLGPIRAGLSFALTDSRVRALAETYSGDLAVGDRVPEVPQSSGSLSLTWDHGSAHVTVGSSYIGPWTGYDWLAFYGGEVGSLPQRASLRQYLVQYPALMKPYVAISQALTSNIEWFARVDNVSNTQRNERDNLQITSGRTTTVGLRLFR